MGKIMTGLAALVLSATATLTGCSASHDYGAKETLYLAGPHGEPSSVLNTKGAPEPRSLRFRVYETEKGNFLTVEDFECRKIGKAAPKEYQISYAKYPNGEIGLALIPIKVGIQKVDYSPKPAENPGKEVEPSAPSP